jgi:hypothetical protein
MVKNTKGGSSHKKLARKKEDENKTIKIDLDVDFINYMIVKIDKNQGNSFTATKLHYQGPDPPPPFNYNGTFIVSHQRGRRARSIYEKSQSRLALVSIVTDIKLQDKAIGYVEEIIEVDHLNAYLREKLIDQATYNLLNDQMVSRVEEDDAVDMGGFAFDRTNGTIKEEKEKEKKEGKEGEESDVDINDI